MIFNAINKSRIGKEFLFRVILFSSIITLLLTGAQLYLEFKTDFHQVKEIQKQIDISYYKSVENAVWGINEQQINALLEGIVALPTVIEASIINLDGSKYLSQKYKVNETNNKLNYKINNNITETFSRKLYSQAGLISNVIATLVVQQSHANAYANLNKRVLVVLLANFVKTFLVASFILIVFHNLVARHLMDISRFIQQTSVIKENRPLVLNRPSTPRNKGDELDVFTQSFNKLNHELHSSWQEIEGSEKRYRELVEGSLQATLIINFDCDFLYGNQQLFSILDIEKNKHIENLNLYFTEKVRLIIDNYISNQYDKPLHVDEVAIITQTKEIRYVQAVVMKIKHDDNDALQIVMFDVSHLKEMRSRQQDYELQLIQKNKMESVGVMLSGVTHEINNPNHLINQNSIILKDTWESLKGSFQEFYENNPEAIFNNLTLFELQTLIPELIDDITFGSENINRIITDLKSFIREEHDQTIELININELITDVAHTLRIIINDKCNHFELDLADSLPKILGTKQRLSQVFINLIVNALEALENPDGSVAISTKADDKNLIISIKDTGIGIVQFSADNIFDAFFTTKAEAGGTGLGLSISQSIILQHHGEIKLNKNYEKGAEFIIKLPINNKSLVATDELVKESSLGS